MIQTYNPMLIGLVAHSLSNYISVTSATVEMLQLTLRDTSDAEVPIWLEGIGRTADLMQHSVSRLVSMSAPRDFPSSSIGSTCRCCSSAPANTSSARRVRGDAHHVRADRRRAAGLGRPCRARRHRRQPARQRRARLRPARGRQGAGHARARPRRLQHPRHGRRADAGKSGGALRAAAAAGGGAGGPAEERLWAGDRRGNSSGAWMAICGARASPAEARVSHSACQPSNSILQETEMPKPR